MPESGLKTPLHRSDWTTSRFKFLFDRRRRVLREDDGIVTAFRDGVVTLRSKRREDGFTFADKEIGYQGVEPDDLVIHAMDGFAGAIGVSDSRGKCSPVYTIAVPQSEEMACPQFWAYYLRNLATTGFIESLAKGIRERSTDFRWKDAGNLLVNFPSYETQKAIADFLDRETTRIDQLIEKKQRFIQLNHEKLSAIIHDCANKSSSASEQPLKRFCRIVTGKTPSRAEEGNFSNEDGLPWATPANLGFFEPIQTTKENLTEEGTKGQVVVPRGTVLINGIGASVGKIGFAGCEMTFNQQIHGIIQFQKILKDRFLFFVMYTKKDEIVALAANTTIPIINAERFARISVPLPSEEFQANAVQIMEVSVEYSRKLNEAVAMSINRLRELRAALITAAVTGQLDVTTWRKQGSTDHHLATIQEEISA